MSKDNVEDHPCNKQINFINDDELSESGKMSLFNISHSSENVSNAHEKNNFKSTSTDDVFEKQLIGTNIVHGSSQLNQAECKFIIEKINSNETNLSSQDENLLFELVKKNNGHIFSTDSEVLDLNTQQYMDLHFCKAVQQLNAFSPTLNLDSSKPCTINQIDSDNSTIISPTKDIYQKKSKTKNKNSIIVSDPKKSEKFNYPSTKIDLELSTRDRYVEYLGEDQDPEIIEFRAMCETMLKIGAFDNNIIDNNKIVVKKNNQLNKLVFKQVNHSVISCLNNTEDEPSTSKLNSGINSIFFKGSYDISKRLARKRHQINDLRFDSFDDSSPKYLNELSSKHYNSKTKKTKVNSKCYSDPIVFQPENVKRIKLSDLTFENKEVNCMLINNPLPKVQNITNDLKCKKVNDDSLKQKKLLNENQKIFYYSSAGKVHNDMLNYIKKKKCHSIY